MNIMKTSRNGDLLHGIDPAKPIHVIGCGATGSFVATTLARTGFRKLILCDFDIVSDVNISNQAFDYDMIGINKAEACSIICKRINPAISIEVITQKITEDNVDTLLSGTKSIFVCTDTMESRSLIYTSLKWKGCKYVESRLDYLQFQVFSVVTPNDLYEKTLKKEGIRAVSACGSPISICFTSQALASFMIGSYIELMKESIPKEGELLVSIYPPALMYNEYKVQTNLNIT